MSFLEVADLQVSRSGTPVLHGVSLRVEEHEAVCLLGRNGMGKTTLLRTIMGLDRPRAGSIRFAAREMGGQPPHRIAHSGIAYVPQGRQIFAELTVDENLQLAASRPSSN